MAFNGRFGIRVGNTSIGNNIRQNSMHDNGELGIDLNADGVSLNDLNDVDNGGNGRLNIPVITETRILGGDLFLKGYARPGATMEFFISDNDATGFGEGKTYLFTVVEGSGADGDATTGTYGPAAVNGTVQGTDNTNKFSFTVPVPGSVVNGTKLTATATLANNTSEFSATTTATLDLDYDDDGIPDLAEGFCTPISNNSDAEEPLITGPTPYIADYGSIRVYDAGQVPYWSTTAVDNAIEIWNNANSTSVPHCDANTGNQFMELNANYVASNYQDIATIPNSVITWSVAHRGRDGVDVATVSIGAPGSVAVQQTMTDGNLAWVTYSGIYVVPAGQSTTRFQFDAVSSSSGDPAAGNFIDSFTLSCSNDADTDGDGIPDYKDLDSDNDGIYDCVESGVNKPFTNGVLDGPVNPNGIPVAADTDGDGVIDYLIKDSDSDGIYDFTELDSDGDGCPDVIEAGFTDVNSDGTPGPAPITVSGNGLVTSSGP